MKYHNARLGITHEVQPFEKTRIRLLKELGFVEVVDKPTPKEDSSGPTVKTIDDRGAFKEPVGSKSTSTPASTVQGPQRANTAPKNASTSKPAPKKS